MQVRIINNSKCDISGLESLIRDNNIEISEDAKSIIYFGDDEALLQKTINECETIEKFVYVSVSECYFLRKRITDSLRYHQYVQKFVACEKLALKYAEKINISIVELPNIYGTPDGIIEFSGVPAVNLKRFFLTFPGGNVFITPENASQAVLAVLFNGKQGYIYPIADESLKYKDALLKKLPEGTKVYEYPEELNFILYLVIKSRLKKEGKTPMINIKKMYKETLLENYFYDDSDVKSALKYENK